MYTPRKIAIIFGLLIVTSFFLHSAPYFMLDTTRYNFWDTDSWYGVYNIDALIHNRQIDLYFTSISVIGILFVNATDTPLMMFNQSGFIPPVLLILFALSTFILMSNIFDRTAGIYTSIILLFVSGSFFQNSTWGYVDHHLLEAFMITVSVLSIIGYAKLRSCWYLIPLCVSMFVLYFTSALFLFYCCIIVFIIWIYLLSYIWNKLKSTFIFIIVLLIIPIISTYYLKNIYLTNLLFNWTEPINELSPPNIVIFFLRLNFLLPVIGYGVYKTIRIHKYDPAITSLLFIAVTLFIFTLKFSRIEYIFIPFIAMISGYYLYKHFKTDYAVMFLTLFVTLSVIISILSIGIVTGSAHYHYEWNEVVTFMDKQPPGMVLAYADYGHWLNASGRPVFTNPSQLNAAESAHIFTTDAINATLLMKQYNIRYVIIRDDNDGFYRNLLYYTTPQVPFNQSYINIITKTNELDQDIIFSTDHIRIHKLV